MSSFEFEHRPSLKHSNEGVPTEFGFWPNATLKFFISDKCSLNCDGCFNNSGLKSLINPLKQRRLSAQQIFSAMNDARDTFGTYAVEFSGGEPTLETDLPQFISLGKSKGFVTRVVTNGTVLGSYGSYKKRLDQFLPNSIAQLSAQERIDTLLVSGLDRITFSVDNMHAMLDDDSKTKGIISPKVPISVVTNAIQILLNKGFGFPRQGNILHEFSININMTASGTDYQPSRLLVEEVMAGVGAKPVFKIGERLPKVWTTEDGQQIRLNRNEVADIGRGSTKDLTRFENLEDLFSRNCFDFVPRSQSTVGRGISQEIVVNYDGEVYNCAMQSYPLGNINQNSLPEIVEYTNSGNPPKGYEVGAKMFMEIMHIVKETNGTSGWGEAYRRILEMDPNLKPELLNLKSHSGACHALGHSQKYLELLQEYRRKH